VAVEPNINFRKGGYIDFDISQKERDTFDAFYIFPVKPFKSELGFRLQAHRRVSSERGPCKPCRRRRPCGP